MATPIEEAGEALFSYGTLQNPEVQRRNYGRLLDGHSDTLSGFRLGKVAISDPEVVRVSGAALHPAIAPDESGDDRVDGALFRITAHELEQTDKYEAGEYTRIRVTLDSGEQAWTYIAAPGIELE